MRLILLRVIGGVAVVAAFFFGTLFVLNYIQPSLTAAQLKDGVRLTEGKFVFPAAIVPGSNVVQRFKPITRIKAIKVPFVTFGRAPGHDLIAWRVAAKINGSLVTIGEGKIDPVDSITDFGEVNLPLSKTPPEIPEEVEVSINTATATYPSAAMGVPLCAPGAQPVPALVADKPRPDGAQVALRIFYAP
jgi:hypothetical protein